MSLLVPSILSSLYLISLYRCADPRDLHSFPTRRSSDLLTRGLWLIFIEFTVVRLAWSFSLDLNLFVGQVIWAIGADRKSTRLNSSHVAISYAVFCLKKKKHDCSCDKHRVDHDDRKKFL